MVNRSDGLTREEVLEGLISSKETAEMSVKFAGTSASKQSLWYEKGRLNGFCVALELDIIENDKKIDIVTSKSRKVIYSYERVPM